MPSGAHRRGGLLHLAHEHVDGKAGYGAEPVADPGDQEKVLCQGARYWIISSLGSQWNTRVIVVPGAARVVARGPYRWFTHPNYVVVAVEGIALPLVHTAWITAIAFTVLNAVLLLAFRIPTENRALRELT